MGGPGAQGGGFENEEPRDPGGEEVVHSHVVGELGFDHGKEEDAFEQVEEREEEEDEEREGPENGEDE